MFNLISTGMFDYQDLVSYVLLVFQNKQTVIKPDEAEKMEVKEIVSRAAAHRSVSVQLVADLSDQNPLYAGKNSGL